MIYENLIIGSGPTSAILVSELLKLDKKIVVIDIGYKIEQENLEIKKNYLKDKNKKKFIKSIRNKKILNKYKNPHLKFPLGSEFVFKKNNYENFISEKNLDYVLSNAYGGLSNIWGTLVSPFFSKDIKNWDISYDEYYRDKLEVEKIIPVSSSNDNLMDFFGINFGKNHSYNLSNGANVILNSLIKRKDQLNKKGFFFGRSKVAVGNFYSHNKLNCQECGLCHYGCPYDCMFSSSQLFDQYKKNKNFTYISNKFVKKISQQNVFKTLECIDVNSNELSSYTAKNIFLCCGPISSAAILFRSDLVKENKVVFKESQRFFLPIFNKKNISNSISQDKNVLSELFFEIYDKNFLEKSVHLQYYTFLDMYLKPLEKILGKYAYLLPKIFPFIFGRLNLIIGYLHSDYSNKIVMTKSSSNEVNKFYYNLAVEKNLILDKAINKVTSYLKENLKNDFYIYQGLTNINLTGASYHYGSSFPMSKTKNSLINQTNLNGELDNCQNLFLLDSSILPDMPGHPTTFNVCVNVARIIKNLNKEGKV